MIRRTLTIGSLSEQTGLSVHTIRAWETRHRALRPTRTEGGHRLYGEEDVVRLCLLRDLARLGHRLSAVTKLSTPDLRSLLGPAPSRVDDGLERLEHAVRTLDPAEAVRAAGAILAGGKAARAIDTVLAPFLGRVGDAWAAGTMGVAHERIASSAVESALRPLLGDSSGRPLALSVVPEGEFHDIGALFAAVAARENGWGVICPSGPLPAKDIALLAREREAKLVLVSIVSLDSAAAAARIAELRQTLPKATKLVVGGRATVGLVMPEGVKHLPALSDLEKLAPPRG